MTWTPQFLDGPLHDAHAKGVADPIDFRLVDRLGEPPEVLFLKRLEGASPFLYRAVEPPLPIGALIYVYQLVRVANAMAFYQVVGQPN